MKTLLVLCLTLGVLPSFGDNRQTTVAPASEAPVSQAPISLYTHFDQNSPAVVIDALHDELDTIMGPMGLSFQWHSLDSVRGNEVSVELAVVTFKGKCDLNSLSMQSDPNPGALGWTHVSDGAILPFADVDCDRIRSFIQRKLLFVHPADREEAFGRALGRVMAHELYHIFANTSHHGSCGVGKAAYSVDELLSDDFQFEGQESKALRTSKAHAALESATHPPSNPPEY